MSKNKQKESNNELTTMDRMTTKLPPFKATTTNNTLTLSCLEKPLSSPTIATNKSQPSTTNESLERLSWEKPLTQSTLQSFSTTEVKPSTTTLREFIKEENPAIKTSTIKKPITNDSKSPTLNLKRLSKTPANGKNLEYFFMGKEFFSTIQESPSATTKEPLSAVLKPFTATTLELSPTTTVAANSYEGLISSKWEIPLATTKTFIKPKTESAATTSKHFTTGNEKKLSNERSTTTATNNVSKVLTKYEKSPTIRNRELTSNSTSFSSSYLAYSQSLSFDVSKINEISTTNPSEATPPTAATTTNELNISKSREISLPSSTSTETLLFLTTMPVMNNKNIENKCTLRESFPVSYQKDLRAFTTHSTILSKQCDQQQLQHIVEIIEKPLQLQTEDHYLNENFKEIFIQNNKQIKKDIHVSSLLQKDSFISQTRPTQQQQQQQKHHHSKSKKDFESLKFTLSLTLAERKAKLREDFFRSSLPSSSIGENFLAGLPDRSKLNSTKRLLWRNSRSKLKILKEENHHSVLKEDKPESSLLKKPQKASLVEQRKLELARKFLENTKSKTVLRKKSLDLDLDLSKSEIGLKKILTFPKVVQLVQKFDTSAKNNKKMIQNIKTSEEGQKMVLKVKSIDQRNSPLSDEGCNFGQSPYSSDNEDNESIRTTSTILEKTFKKSKAKFARSASSDSALGLEVEEAMDANPLPAPVKRRMTLTVTDLPLRAALLPLAEPTALPDSPTKDGHQFLANNLHQQTAIPSKVLLEERVVEIPEDPRSQISSVSSSRRESAQSCLSDYPTSECGGVRFVRTPSVVVSDYSDDIMCGITLEEIEYFRAQRMRRRRSSLDTSGTEKEIDVHSDVSAASSCSNLYYCGSTISALDGSECYVNGTRMPLERKTSDCSQYSAQSGDEDAFTIPEQPEDSANSLSEILAAQHLNNKRPKKVGYHLQPYPSNILRP